MRDCHIARGNDHLSVLDVVALASQRPKLCVVLPTLDHSLVKWPQYIEALREAHGNERAIKTSKTSAFMLLTDTLLRLWVPYEREPTMWMDWPKIRSEFEMVTPYGRRDAR